MTRVILCDRGRADGDAGAARLAEPPRSSVRARSASSVAWRRQAGALDLGRFPGNAGGRAAHMVFDATIIRRDRGQSVFQQSFLQFSDRMVRPTACRTARVRSRRMQRCSSASTSRSGVPGPVLAAFWGLETDFGTNVGKMSILRLSRRSLSTAVAEFFRPQVIDALRVLQRGDLKINEMMGDWAGEVGPMQFMPSDYFKYGVDFDGDGRRDLRTVADALASSANMLANAGWNAANPGCRKCVCQPTCPGTRLKSGSSIRDRMGGLGRQSAMALPFRPTGLQASLLIPMGRQGPAFLAYPNFQGYLKWNQAMVYAITAAYYATRLSGAPPVSRTGRIS